MWLWAAHPALGSPFLCTSGGKRAPFRKSSFHPCSVSGWSVTNHIIQSEVRFMHLPVLLKLLNKEWIPWGCVVCIIIILEFCLISWYISMTVMLAEQLSLIWFLSHIWVYLGDLRATFDIKANLTCLHWECLCDESILKRYLYTVIKLKSIYTCPYITAFPDHVRFIEA